MNSILAPNGRPARQELKAQYAYDAARYSDTNRAFVWGVVGDADKVLDPYTRQQLITHSMNLWRNFPVVRGIINDIITYVVGSGINPVPMSSDPEWNQRAKESFREWQKRPIINQRWTWTQYQRVTMGETLLKGEAFTLHTFGESGRSRLQGFPSHRIKKGGKKSLAGITYNKFGRATHYDISLDSKGDTTRKYPAHQIVHHQKPLLYGQKRGEPILASAINTARDMMEIIGYEKQAVKECSRKTDIIKTKSGELDDEELRGQIFSMDAAGEGTSGGSAVDRTKFYERSFGAEAKVMQIGDEYDPYNANRPGPAWQGFMEFLANSLCLSIGMPPSVMLQMKVGGADTRKDLARAQRTIELWQMDLASEFERCYKYFIQSEIQDGTLIGEPDDWFKVEWQFPKQISVDAGRDAKNDRDDVSNGLMTRREYYGRYGQNEDEQEDIVIAEAVARKDKLAESGLTVEEFAKLLSLNPTLIKADEPQQKTEK